MYQDDGGDDHITQLADQRLLSTNTTQSVDDEILKHTLLNLRPIGLELGNQEFLHQRLFHNSKVMKTQMEDLVFAANAEKKKAINFSAKSLSIGSWNVESTIDGDLVAKIYYAKKRLVWEYLDKLTKLKKKIEIAWHTISAIRATFGTQYDLLDIELSHPPSFHDEDNPTPRKHTCWRVIKDFTDNNASLFRRHQLVFPSGYLGKHYDKLLSYDKHLASLRQTPFPSSESSIFASNPVSNYSNMSIQNSIQPSLYQQPGFVDPRAYASLDVQLQKYEHDMFLQSPVSVLENRQTVYIDPLSTTYSMEPSMPNPLFFSQNQNTSYCYRHEVVDQHNAMRSDQHHELNDLSQHGVLPQQSDNKEMLYHQKPQQQVHFPHQSNNENLIMQQLHFPHQSNNENLTMQQFHFPHQNNNENPTMQQQQQQLLGSDCSGPILEYPPPLTFPGWV